MSSSNPLDIFLETVGQKESHRGYLVDHSSRTMSSTTVSGRGLSAYCQRIPSQVDPTATLTTFFQISLPYPRCGVKGPHNILKVFFTFFVSLPSSQSTITINQYLSAKDHFDLLLFFFIWAKLIKFLNRLCFAFQNCCWPCCALLDYPFC